MISKALVVGAYQRKVEELACLPGVALTVAVPPYWRQEAHRVPLERAYTAGYQLVVLPIALNGHYHVHFYRRLAALLDIVRPDVVHVDEEQYNLATFQAMWLAVRRRIPALFFTWQNIDLRYPPPFAWLERYNLAHATYAIAGNADAAAVIRAKGYAGPVAVIPQFGVDPALFRPRPAGETAQAPKRPFVIGFVAGAGRLIPAKGLHVLLAALAGLSSSPAAQVADSVGAAFTNGVGGWELRVIGTGEAEAGARALAARLGIADRVVFLGRQPSTAMPEIIRDFDLLAGPSLTTPRWKEQFGRMFVEAMASGVPVIGSNSGEIPNVIGDAGIVVPEGDEVALRAAITRLYHDETERRRLAERGRARVLDRYTQAAVARRTHAVYQEMASNAL